MPDDDVTLTDLAVIQQFSLAVRGATASRDDVVRALEADLAWLSGRRAAPAAGESAAPARRARKAPAKTAARRRPASEE